MVLMSVHVYVTMPPIDDAPGLLGQGAKEHQPLVKLYFNI